MNRTALRFAISGAIVAGGLALIVGTGTGPIAPTKTTVDPSVGTLARFEGLLDINQSHSCLPESPASPPQPYQWWNSLVVGQPPKVAGAGVVGFNIWRNQQDSCETSRKDLYRPVVTFDLGPVVASKGLITKAELRFAVAVLPVVRAGSPCQAVTGGALTFLRMPLGTAVPPGGFLQIPGNGPFPSGSPIFSIPSPWLSGQIAPGVTTTGGPGGAGFTVDVLSLVNAALNANATSLAFALSGSDETPIAVSPPDQFDCRTYYRFNGIQITHY